MQVQEPQTAGVLRLEIGERALVGPPESQEILRLRGPDTVLVALDLRGAEFISSLFLQGCIELARTLAASGQQLVLLHLTPQQERLLEFVEGSSRLTVLNDDTRMDDQLRSLSACVASGAPDDAVTRAEKLMLWG
jgi:hypothetical protein